MKKAVILCVFSLFTFLSLSAAKPKALAADPSGPCSGGTNGHCTTLTITMTQAMVSGTGFNIYRGTTAGGEISTAINPALITVTGTCSSTSPCTATFEDDAANVPKQSYYYTAKACDPTGVCSAASTEASATIPLASTDLPVPGITVSGH